MIEPINNLWLAMATVLVLCMQAGFLLFESGRVRAKNSINVAQKNITDLVVSWTVFFCFGYGLMYGLSVPFGANADPQASDQQQIHAMLTFLYQLGFCATAASIVSGGVAERIPFRVYLMLSAATAALIYPFVGRMVWGVHGSATSGTWLSDIGFVDFAGSTVVHGVGAWVTLAGIVAIGPRLGRFDEHGKPLPIAGHNAVISLLGVFILFLGWFGFNAGSLSPSDPRFALVLLNTCSAACFGALAGIVSGAALDAGQCNPARITGGMLGGLVAITACANIASPWDAAMVGMLGGLVATLGSEWLLVKARLDDPVDVVAVHGFAGVVGTLAVAFVGPAGHAGVAGRFAQAGIQLTGVTAVFLFTFGSAWVFLRALSLVMPLRVSAEDERMGLNITEHGEAMGAERLKRAMQERLAGNLLTDTRFDDNEGDESAELAFTLNELMQRHAAARDSLRQSEQRFEDFARSASDWLWETDTDNRMHFVSARHGEDDEAVQERLMGRRLTSALVLRAEDLRRLEADMVARASIGPYEASIAKADQARLLVEVRGAPWFDASGVFGGYRGTLNDITERRAAERRALFLSRHDELTSLANRRALAEDVIVLRDSALQRGSTLVFASIDLDDFKGVNDAHGHGVGDRLLRQVAARIRATVRPVDRLYRTGGDEFVLVLSDFDEASAQTLATDKARDLIRFVGAPYQIGGARIEIGASIGLAIAGLHGDDVNDLVRVSDLALYAAKAAGKGCVKTFEPSMDIDAQQRQRLESELRDAVREQAFTLEYQPQHDGASGALVGFEALLRWDHAGMGRLSPVTFIPVAERLRLMGDIGAFVLREACRFAATLPRQADGPALMMAVNVSPSQFATGRVVKDVNDALAESGLPAAQLELEITEEMLIENVEHVRAQLHDLRALGVSIAIDDFGSGQASLRYLNQFPISKLKIDRSFIRHLGTDTRADDITQSIVMLGHKLGCKVVAEGVEQSSQAELLRSWRCDLMQGFMFARPMSGTDVHASLAVSTSHDAGDASVTRRLAETVASGTINDDTNLG